LKNGATDPCFARVCCNNDVLDMAQSPPPYLNLNQQGTEADKAAFNNRHPTMYSGLINEIPPNGRHLRDIRIIC